MAVENARMEWNNARLKFPLLNHSPAAPEALDGPAAPGDWPGMLRQKSYPELCKLGLALTWPVALVGLLILVRLILGH